MIDFARGYVQNWNIDRILSKIMKESSVCGGGGGAGN